MSKPKNKDRPSQTGRSKSPVSEMSKKQKTSNSHSKNAKIEDIRKTIDEELDLKKAKRIVPGELIDKIPPEKRYVRRTAEEFEAGAKPIKAGSHRLVEVKVRVTPELKSAIKEAVRAADVKDSLWLRAAIRKAIREGVDVEYEIETPIDLSKLEPDL